MAAIRDAAARGHRAVLVAESAGLAARMAEVLGTADVPCGQAGRGAEGPPLPGS